MSLQADQALADKHIVNINFYSMLNDGTYI